MLGLQSEQAEGEEQGEENKRRVQREEVWVWRGASLLLTSPNSSHSHTIPHTTMLQTNPLAHSHTYEPQHTERIHQKLLMFCVKLSMETWRLLSGVV